MLAPGRKGGIVTRLIAAGLLGWRRQPSNPAAISRVTIPPLRPGASICIPPGGVHVPNWITFFLGELGSFGKGPLWVENLCQGACNREWTSEPPTAQSRHCVFREEFRTPLGVRKSFGQLQPLTPRKLPPDGEAPDMLGFPETLCLLRETRGAAIFTE